MFTFTKLKIHGTVLFTLGSGRIFGNISLALESSEIFAKPLAGKKTTTTLLDGIHNIYIFYILHIIFYMIYITMNHLIYVVVLFRRPLFTIYCKQHGPSFFFGNPTLKLPNNWLFHTSLLTWWRCHQHEGSGSMKVQENHFESAHFGTPCSVANLTSSLSFFFRISKCLEPLFLSGSWLLCHP